MRRDAAGGLSLVDVVVVLALLALLAWLVRMDWAGHRAIERAEPTAIARP